MSKSSLRIVLILGALNVGMAAYSSGSGASAPVPSPAAERLRPLRPASKLPWLREGVLGHPGGLPTCEGREERYIRILRRCCHHCGL